MSKTWKKPPRKKERKQFKLTATSENDMEGHKKFVAKLIFGAMQYMHHLLLDSFSTKEQGQNTN